MKHPDFEEPKQSRTLEQCTVSEIVKSYLTSIEYADLDHRLRKTLGHGTLTNSSDFENGIANCVSIENLSFTEQQATKPLCTSVEELEKLTLVTVAILFAYI